MARNLDALKELGSCSDRGICYYLGMSMDAASLALGLVLGAASALCALYSMRAMQQAARGEQPIGTVLSTMRGPIDIVGRSEGTSTARSERLKI